MNITYLDAYNLVDYRFIIFDYYDVSLQSSYYIFLLTDKIFELSSYHRKYSDLIENELISFILPKDFVLNIAFYLQSSNLDYNNKSMMDILSSGIFDDYDYFDNFDKFDLELALFNFSNSNKSLSNLISLYPVDMLEFKYFLIFGFSLNYLLDFNNYHMTIPKNLKFFIDENPTLVNDAIINLSDSLLRSFCFSKQIDFNI